MPFSISNERAEFTLTTTPDGLPLAKVITLDNGRWIACCPCCGMIHDVTTHKSDIYEPRCIVKQTHPKAYAAWIAQHPDAAKYSRVMLTNADSADLRKPEPLKIVEKPKRTRRKAA